jgi:hypothetical protein
MNNVYIYVILTTIQLVVKNSLRLFVPLIFASWCLPYKTPFTIVSILNLGNILMEQFL